MAKNPFFKKLLECSISDLIYKKKCCFVYSIIMMIFFVFFILVTGYLYFKGYIVTGVYVFILAFVSYFIGLDCATERERLSLWIYLKKQNGDD